MRIYNYDRDSGEFIDAADADPDPLTPGEYLLPAFATPTEPPATRPLQAAVFDAKVGAWHTVDVSYRLGDAVLRVIAQRLQDVGPLYDAYSDLAALGELDANGLDYLQSLRMYRAQLRQVHQQPNFPHNVTMPEAPPLHDVPADPLRAPARAGG